MGDSRCTTLTCPEMKASITCAQLRSSVGFRFDAGLVEQAVVVRHQQRRGVGDRQIADAHRRVGLGLGARIESGQQRRRPPALSSAVSFNQSRRDMCSRHIPRLLVSCSDEGSNRYRRFGRRASGRSAPRRRDSISRRSAPISGSRSARGCGRSTAHSPSTPPGAPPSSTMRSASSSASSISGDQQRGGADVGHHLAQQRLHFGARDLVQRPERLVQQQHRRLAGSAPARCAAPCRRTAGPAAAGGRATGRLPRWPGPRAARSRASSAG